MEMRARENLCSVLRLKPLTAVPALNELHKGVGDFAHVAIVERVHHLVCYRARLTQVSVRALFNRLGGIVELEVTVSFDLFYHLVQIRHLNRNVIDVVLVKECPCQIIILLLNPLIIGIGFDLLEDWLLVLAQKHAKTRMLQPDGMDIHVRKVIEVWLLTETERCIVGENRGVPQASVGDVVIDQLGLGEEATLDIMEGGRVLVVFREFV